MSTPAPLTLDHPEEVEARIAAYLDGAPLTGLDLYYALEEATPLLQFHTMLRGGPRNQEANGLQQSYGDHNRLLLLGLDKLLEGDLDWYRKRVAPGAEVPDGELVDCFASVAGFGFDRAGCLALWVGAALHDCGMLCGRGADLDVEDGVVLAQDLIDALCPPDVAGLARFALHNHDYIKDVFTGSVPVRLVAEALEQVDPQQRRAALGALGMIQVAGAASLGTGRLTPFRMEIFRRCAAGTALDGDTTALRLARLLQPGEVEHVASTAAAEAALDALAADDRDLLTRFLAEAAVHGWHRAAQALDAPARLEALLAVARRWDRDPVSRIVLGGEGALAGSGVDARREVTLSDTEVLVLG